MPAHNRKLPPEEKLRELFTSGMKSKEIAAIYDCEAAAVSRARARMLGSRSRRGFPPPEETSGRILPQATEEKVVVPTIYIRERQMKEGVISLPRIRWLEQPIKGE